MNEKPWKRADEPQVYGSAGVKIRYGWLFVMTLPSFIWALLDRSVWPPDACQYGESALKLATAFSVSSGAWLEAMLSTDVIHPPILIWVGQTAVPLGRLLGSYDAGFLVVSLAVHLVALVFLFEALSKLFDTRHAFIGCLVLASTPLFIGVGKQFVIQPVQLLVVAWFVYIVANTREWDVATILLHLTAASSLALLSMLSTPSFCVLLGLAALVGLRGKKVRFTASHIPMLGLCAVLFLPGSVWYLINGDTAMEYAAHAYRTPWVTRVEDIYLAKLGQWVDFIYQGFFLSPVTFLLVALVCVLAVAKHVKANGTKTRSLGFAALVVLQILFALALHAGSGQQLYRYALPFTVLLTVAIAWALYSIDSRWVTWVVGGAFLLQGVLFHASDFGVISISRKYWSPDLTVGEQRAFELMDVIVERTIDSRKPVLVELRAFFIDGAHVSYQAWKSEDFATRALAGNTPEIVGADVFLTSEGIDGDVDTAWDTLLMRSAGFYVMPNETLRSEFAQSLRLMSQTDTSALAEQRSLKLAEKVAEDNRFRKIDLAEYPELALYEYRAPDPEVDSNLSRRVGAGDHD